MSQPPLYDSLEQDIFTFQTNVREIGLTKMLWQSKTHDAQLKGFRNRLARIQASYRVRSLLASNFISIWFSKATPFLPATIQRGTKTTGHATDPDR